MACPSDPKRVMLIGGVEKKKGVYYVRCSGVSYRHFMSMSKYGMYQLESVSLCLFYKKRSCHNRKRAINAHIGRFCKHQLKSFCF